MKQKRKTHNRQWWASELSKCAKSGLSLAEYARQNNIKVGTIYKWKSLLASDSRLIKPSPPATASLAEEAVGFVEVTMPTPSEQMLKLESPDGWTIRVSSQISEESLSKILRALEGRS